MNRKVLTMDNSLCYWNLRAVEARNSCNEDESPANCEELAFARCMVTMPISSPDTPSNVSIDGGNK